MVLFKRQTGPRDALNISPGGSGANSLVEELPGLLCSKRVFPGAGSTVMRYER